MMDYREYRLAPELHLGLDSAEVLDLCVRRGEESEKHGTAIKDQSSSPTPSSEEVAQYPNAFPLYADTAQNYPVAPQTQPFRPDAFPFGTALRSSGSPEVVRPQPTMVAPNAPYFPLQQSQQKKHQFLNALLQPNSPPPSATSECHITLPSPTRTSHSSSSSECSSVPATSPTAPAVTQTPAALALGFMLQTPKANPVLPSAVPTQVHNSSNKGNSGKLQRPFKAINISPSRNVLCSADYLQFRQRMLETMDKRICKRNRNPPAKRAPSPSQQPSSSDGNGQSGGGDGDASGTPTLKDAAYRERRKKNNEAAKRSRDARREKEDELAIRTSFLEQENMILKYQVISLEKKLGIYPSPNTLRWKV